MTNFLSGKVYNTRMETIYIDSLFFINLIIDYFTLLCTAKVASARIRRIPIAIGAIIGGLYACLCVLPGWEFATHPLVKLSSGILMCLTAFWKEPQFLRCSIIFFLVSAGFGGIIWAVSMFGGYNVTGMPIYFPINSKVLVLSFALAYLVISIVFRRFSQTAGQEIRSVRVILHGQSAEFPALRDTGNSLYDPVSNCSVMVCESTVVKSLFPGHEILLEKNDPAELLYVLSEDPAYSGRLRLIPFQSVGGSGLLFAFRPDELTIDGVPAEDTLVAVTSATLSTYQQYQGIY